MPDLHLGFSGLPESFEDLFLIDCHLIKDNELSNIPAIAVGIPFGDSPKSRALNCQGHGNTTCEFILI